MKINLEQIFREKVLPIEGKEILNNVNKGILNNPEVDFSGEIRVINDTKFNIYLEVTSSITLSCSVSLKQVAHQVDTSYQETYTIEENNEDILISDTYIDINDILVDILITEIPLRILHEDAYQGFETNGEGYNVYQDESDIKPDIKENPFYKYFNKK